MRLLWLLPLIAALLPAGTAARALAATVYHEYAATLRWRQPASAAALTGSALAARLAPWSADAWDGLAASRALQRPPQQGWIAASAQALRLAPADAQLWRHRAIESARTRGYGDDYRRALERMQQLAPASRSLHMAAALDAIYDWRHGDEGTRALWVISLRVASHTRRSELLRRIALSRRETFACAYFGDLVGIDAWCAQAVTRRSWCDRPALPVHHRSACDRQGFVPARTP